APERLLAARHRAAVRGRLHRPALLAHLDAGVEDGVAARGQQRCGSDRGGHPTSFRGIVRLLRELSRQAAGAANRTARNAGVAFRLTGRRQVDDRPSSIHLSRTRNWYAGGTMRAARWLPILLMASVGMAAANPSTSVPPVNQPVSGPESAIDR